MSSTMTSKIETTVKAADEEPSNYIWSCCMKMQQRYIFMVLSMIGSMAHVIMALSMNVAIVAMVKDDFPKNSSNNNITLQSDVCPVNSEDETPGSDSSSESGDFDWDEVTQGYILTAASYGSVISGIIGARIAELWSPKMMYGITQVASAACNVFIPLAAKWDVSALITLRVIQGIFNGPMIAIHSILIASWLPPQERTKLIGIYYSAVAVGTVLSMFLTGILITEFGWESTFYIYAVIVFVWAVFWFIFIFDTPNEHPGISKAEREYIVTSVPKNHNVRYPVPWLSMFMSPPLWAHISMACGNIWIVYILLTEVPTYMKNVLHYDTEKTGFVSALPWVATFIGNVSFGILSQFLKRRGYLSQIGAYRVFNAFSTLGPAVALICITQMGCDSLSIIILLVVTNGLNAAFVGGSVYNLIDLSINFTGTTHGISWMFSQVIGILAPTITSRIINNNQTVSSWSLVFYISAGVAVCPYLIFLLFGSVEEQPWNKPITEEKKEQEFSESKDIEKCT